MKNITSRSGPSVLLLNSEFLFPAIQTTAVIQSAAKIKRPP